MGITMSELASLTPKQIKCLPLLAVGMSAAKVAKKLNVSQVQISSWKNDLQFMSALEEFRRNALREAETALTGLAVDAVNVLKGLLVGARSEATRLRVAMYIIDRLGLVSNIETNDKGSNREIDMVLLLAALGAS